MPRPGIYASEALQTPPNGLESACPVCGRPLVGRRQTCSGACRGALHRHRQAEAQVARDAELR
jgi:hypothetical protein